jgi:hypothetical protein
MCDVRLEMDHIYKNVSVIRYLIDQDTDTYVVVTHHRQVGLQSDVSVMTECIDGLAHTQSSEPYSV